MSDYRIHEFGDPSGPAARRAFARAAAEEMRDRCRQHAHRNAIEAADHLGNASVFADWYDFRAAGEEMRAATVGLLKAAAWSALAGMVRA